MSKCVFVKQAISDKHLSHGIKEAKRWFKDNDWRAFWYPEFQDMAKRMLKDYRRRDP